MLACVRSAMLFGVEGFIVDVEVHVSAGLPAYTFVGLPDAAVRESRDRVRAALLSSGLSWPQRRVTVNLAPSGVRKSGPGLDLPFALGLMTASDELPAGALEGIGVLGELGLDGSLRPVPGVLAMVDALRRSGMTAVIVPAGNAGEAALVGNLRILPARSLTEARAALKGEGDWAPASAPSDNPTDDDGPEDDTIPDLAVVRGLASGRRALEVAAAGGHHLLMVGRPGAGKTLLARCAPSILPPLDPEEALEVTRIHSAAGRAISGRLVRQRPFRAPHHTASAAALVGGGSGRPRLGEITMAHHGILFMDELAEFPPASSTPSANRSRTGSSASPGRVRRSPFRPTSCSSRPQTRAPAALVCPTACVARRTGPVTDGVSRRRSSTASTCGSRSALRLRAPRPARRRRSSRLASPKR